MPIINYKRVAETSKKRFFDKEDVNEINKGYIKKFLNAYDVNNERLGIFINNIYSLYSSKDL